MKTNQERQRKITLIKAVLAGQIPPDLLEKKDFKIVIKVEQNCVEYWINSDKVTREQYGKTLEIQKVIWGMRQLNIEIMGLEDLKPASKPPVKNR